MANTHLCYYFFYNSIVLYGVVCFLINASYTTCNNFSQVYHTVPIPCSYDLFLLKSTKCAFLSVMFEKYNRH